MSNLSQYIQEDYIPASITLNEAVPLVEAAILARQNFYLEGLYGIGKTSICQQLSEKYKLPFYLRNPSKTGYVQVFGLPSVQNGMTVHAVPKNSPPEDEPVTLCIDEFNTAPPHEQPMWYDALLNNQLGDVKLHPDSIVCATGNTSNDSIAVNEMAGPARDRFLGGTYLVRPDAKEVIAFMASNGAHASIMGFIGFDETCILGHNLECTCGGSTPRALWGLSNMVKATAENNLNVDRNKQARAIIGPDYGAKFAAFLDAYHDLVRPADILKNPNKCRIPDVEKKAAVVWASVSALAVKACDADNFPKGLIWTERAGKQFSALYCQIASRRNPKEIENCVEYLEWRSENAGLLK